MLTAETIKLKPAGPDDWQIISEIAHGTWPHTFGAVISEDQIDYMLGVIYNEASLRNQMAKGHCFILAEKKDEPLGFASYELNYQNAPVLMIHKLYLLPSSQGMGIGKRLLDHLTAKAKEHKHTTLRLKVFYKNDKAAGFYQHYGFNITGTETSDPGNGYIILDHVMSKDI